MTSKNQLATWIIASILIPTIPAILAGIILSAIEPHASSTQSPVRVVIEIKPPAPEPNPPPPQPPRPKQPPLSPAPTPIFDKNDAQQKEIDALKEKLAELQRDATRRKDFETKPPSERGTTPEKGETPVGHDPYTMPPSPTPEPTAPSKNVNPIPQPTVVPLYYRVASVRTRQVEDGKVEGSIRFLNSLNISYTRGRERKDSWRGPQYVPIGIRSTSWQPYNAESEAHRERIMSKMVALGIEATVEKPEEMDD